MSFVPRLVSALLFCLLCLSVLISKSAGAELFFDQIRTTCFVGSGWVTGLWARKGSSRMWIATRNGGLILRRGDGKLRRYGPSDGLTCLGIVKILFFEDTTLALGKDGVIYSFDPAGRCWSSSGRRAFYCDATVFRRALWVLDESGRVSVRSAGKGRFTVTAGARLQGDGVGRFVDNGPNLIVYNETGALYLKDDRWVRVGPGGSYRILCACSDNRRAVFCHGRAGLTLLDRNGAWRHEYFGNPPLQDYWKIFCTGKETWLSLRRGLLFQDSDHAPWRLFYSCEPRFTPGLVCSFAAHGNYRWFGTTSGILWEHDRDAATWRPLTKVEGLPGGAVTSLAVCGDRLFIGTERGLACLDTPGGFPRAIPLPGGPAGRFVASAAFPDGRVFLSDGEYIHLLLSNHGRWLPSIIRQKASRLAAGLDGNLWTFSDGIFTEWQLYPIHRLKKLRLPDDAIVDMVVSPGLIFALSRSRLFRVDLQRGGVQAALWSAAPPFRAGRGNWVTESPSALAVDSNGVIVGMKEGIIKRAYSFSRDVPVGVMGRFRSPRMAVTALAVQGRWLYAALEGKRGGIWRRPVSGKQASWRRLLPSSAWKDGNVVKMAPYCSGMAAMASSGLLLVDPASRKYRLFNESCGTTCSGDLDFSVVGRRLWSAGRGVTLFEIPLN